MVSSAVRGVAGAVLGVLLFGDFLSTYVVYLFPSLGTILFILPSV